MTDWNKKLDAYLHDPPEKVLDLAWHKQRAENYESGLGLEATEFSRDCDHTAAAADRLPWPRWRFLESAFDGEVNFFKHPLGGTNPDGRPLGFKIHPFASADLAHERAWDQRPKLSHGDDVAQFFAFWRFFRWWASDQRDSRLAFLPADTRLPDHTIWVHNSIVSALQSCVSGEGKDARCRPAFLLFQIGPVQDYIAQARRTLDLWSGSYLLSYLIGCGLRHIALNYGPDNVIFPNLCGQPIFDLLLKERVWDRAGTSEHKTLWECFGYEQTPDGRSNDYGRRRLLTPSLPNRFLAVLPADKAADIARDITQEIRNTHKAISAKVWEWASEKLAATGCWTSEQKQRFDAQNERFLDIAWQVFEWPKTPDDARKVAEILPHDDQHQPLSGVDVALEMARRMPRNPDDHRDVRNFHCERFPEGTKRNGRDVSGWKDRSKFKPDAKLDNPGAAWSALYKLVNWQLDAVRQTRAWKAWSAGGWRVGRDRNKDSVNGKEEAILTVGSTENDAKALNDAADIPNLFKVGELLGAATLIKRLWPTAWLQSKDVHPSHDGQPLFERRDFGMPDTRHIAVGQPFAEESGEDGSEESQKYFAVLALDGDEMGQWISGLHKKMPKLNDQFSPGALAYFQKQLPGLLERKRPLSPSFHLQFSEMLANFGNYCVRRVVEAFDGRLIYSGGDDVLALLPASTALECASALREAFRGNPAMLNRLTGAWQRGEKQSRRLFDFDQQGFIRLHSETLCLQGEPKNFHAMVPGPAADCSVGIAIAHFKSPLQDVVRSAWEAEKRAKNKKQLGRSAVAVTLMKRSGEAIEWGCKWDGGGLGLYHAIAHALEAEQLSSKFPYRLAELLGAYVTQTTPLVKSVKTLQPVEEFKVDEVVRREFDHTLNRQRGAKFPNEKDAKADFVGKLTNALDGYLNSLAEKLTEEKSTEEKLQALIGLCQTVAFAHRTSADTASPVVLTSHAERQLS